MTQTLPQITEVITYAPEFPGTVYTAGWTPRTDPQSPDLRVVTGEYVTIAEMMRRAEEERAQAEPEWDPFAGWSAVDVDEDETQPVVDLAAVMPQPGDPEMDGTRKPFLGRGEHRKAPPLALSPGGWMLAGAGVLLLAEAVVGLFGVFVLAVA